MRMGSLLMILARENSQHTILAALDSRQARQVVNQAAWRLGVPWIDTGVNAAQGLLARVGVFVPGPDGPCLECGWSARTYDLIEQAHPCHDERIEAATDQDLIQMQPEAVAGGPAD